MLVELATRPEKPAPGVKVVPGRSENLVLEFDEAYTAFAVEGFERLPGRSSYSRCSG
ncbi:MAG: hypothetical protein R3E53_08985 [Myxococcota bacterium]